MKSKLGTAGSVPDYQVESDVRTLHEANKIKQDEKRHSAAKKHAATMAAGMRTVSNDDGSIAGKPNGDADPDLDEDMTTQSSLGAGMGKAPASSKYTD